MIFLEEHTDITTQNFYRELIRTLVKLGYDTYGTEVSRKLDKNDHIVYLKYKIMHSMNKLKLDVYTVREAVQAALNDHAFNDKCAKILSNIAFTDVHALSQYKEQDIFDILLCALPNEPSQKIRSKSAMFSLLAAKMAQLTNLEFLEKEFSDKISVIHTDSYTTEKISHRDYFMTDKVVRLFVEGKNIFHVVGKAHYFGIAKNLAALGLLENTVFFDLNSDMCALPPVTTLSYEHNNQTITYHVGYNPMSAYLQSKTFLELLQKYDYAKEAIALFHEVQTNYKLVAPIPKINSIFLKDATDKISLQQISDTIKANNIPANKIFLQKEKRYVMSEEDAIGLRSQKIGCALASLNSDHEIMDHEIMTVIAQKLDRINNLMPLNLDNNLPQPAPILWSFTGIAAAALCVFACGRSRSRRKAAKKNQYNSIC